MSKIKNYGKRMKLFFAGAAIVAGMCIMMSVPWAKGFAEAEANNTEYSELEENMHREFDDSQEEETAYVLNVDDTSVVLASLGDVSEVVNTVKAAYDEDDFYDSRQEVIRETADSKVENTDCGPVKEASIEPVNKPIVMAAGEEDGSTEDASSETQQSSFTDKIKITETYAADAQIMSVEDAVKVIKSALQKTIVSKE